MITISPSILSCDFLNIEPELKYFEGIDNIWMHLDIMDGHFVPNLTFGNPIIKMIVSKTNIPCDAHFMVTNPEFYIDTLKDIPLHNFTFHLETCDDSLALIKKAKLHFKSVGISIKPSTEVTKLSDEILKAVDLILVMSVEPGFGGQSFMKNSIDKIKYLKEFKDKNNLNYVIQVDGGINAETSKLVKHAGANNLVAGSYIFKGGPLTYKTKIESLR